MIKKYTYYHSAEINEDMNQSEDTNQSEDMNQSEDTKPPNPQINIHYRHDSDIY